MNMIPSSSIMAGANMFSQKTGLIKATISKIALLGFKVAMTC